MEKKLIAQNFPGEWVLIFNDEIIDHSANVEDILKLCEEKYPETEYPNDDIKISKIFQSTLI